MSIRRGLQQAHDHDALSNRLKVLVTAKIICDQAAVCLLENFLNWTCSMRSRASVVSNVSVHLTAPHVHARCTLSNLSKFVYDNQES